MLARRLLSNTKIIDSTLIKIFIRKDLFSSQKECDEFTKFYNYFKGLSHFKGVPNIPLITPKPLIISHYNKAIPIIDYKIAIHVESKTDLKISPTKDIYEKTLDPKILGHIYFQSNLDVTMKSLLLKRGLIPGEYKENSIIGSARIHNRYGDDFFGHCITDVIQAHDNELGIKDNEEWNRIIRWASEKSP